MIAEIEGFLTGWKSIAAFLGVSIDTAKRYTKKYHCPVYRLPGGTPSAMPHELRTWLSGAPQHLSVMKNPFKSA